MTSPRRALACHIILLTTPLLTSCLWFQGLTFERAFVERPSRGHAVELKRVLKVERPDLRFMGQRAGNRSYPIAWVAEIDSAIRPLLNGEPAQSEVALSALLLRHPGNYYIMADLAVAQELQGKVDTALQTLQGVLRTNPGAHHDTEWMHLRVLEAKQALHLDPHWLATHTISGLPTTAIHDGTTVLDWRGKTRDLAAINSALFAHVLPRLVFAKGEDPIVAAMLVELARTESHLFSLESASDILDLAEGHGATGTGSIRAPWRWPLAVAATQRALASPGDWFLLLLVVYPSVKILLR